MKIIKNRVSLNILFIFLIFIGFVCAEIPQLSSVGDGGGAGGGGGGGGSRVVQPIYDCQELDVENRGYRLEKDIVANDTCFVIKANNILLDLNGYSIVGNDSGQGVYIGIYDKATIKNGLISNFAEGIKIDNSEDNLVENNTIEYNRHQGIYLFKSKNNEISQNYVRGNTDDYGFGEIELDGSDDNILQNNHVKSGANDGIQVFDSDNNSLKDNHIENNEGLGIDLNVADNNIIENNLIEYNGAYGVYMGGGNINENNNNIIDGNTILGHDRGGIKLTSANNIGNIIKDNHIENNDENGIELNGENENNIHDNVIENNYILGNEENGIQMLNVNYNYIKDNFIKDNEGDGIYVGGTSSSNILEGNNIYDNYRGIIFHDEANLNVVENSEIYGAGVGISLSGYNTSLNLLENNEIYNACIGISIGGSHTNSNILKSNILHDNEYSGIKITGGRTNTIENNEIYGNGYYGILFEDILIENFESNLIYNNFFNNTQNIEITEDSNMIVNYWNTTLTPETNIIGGPYIGGNYWAKPDGTGFGQTCEDSDKDRICDSPYELGEGNFDYFPLSSGITPEISIIFPENNSVLKSDFTGLRVDTSENSVCEYSLDDSDFQKIESTDDTEHFQTIFNLEDTMQTQPHHIEVECINGFGNKTTDSITFDVDLSELKEYLILEDIGDYKYLMSGMVEDIDEGMTAMSAYYNKTNNESVYTTATIFKFDNESLFQDFLEELKNEENISIIQIDNQNVYILNFEDSAEITIWNSENDVIVGIIAYYEEGLEKEFSMQLIEAYLEKYPSDLQVIHPDITSPVITLLSPSDNYETKTSSSSKNINFRYKVSDESEIVECDLVIDGSIKETKTNVQKDVENIFSIDLSRDNYDWQIKCIDSKGNQKTSETRSLEISKKSSDSGSSSSGSSKTTQTVSVQNITSISDSKNKTEEAQGTIVLGKNTEEVIQLGIENKKQGLLEKIIGWFRGLFSR